ncbi:ring finger domain-containing protein [Seiridium cupressi]
MSAPASPIEAGAPSHDDDAAPTPQIPDHRDTATSTPRNNETADDTTHRCFICLTDEPDDNLPADWVTPCQCSLEGHQLCLLTWVADLEAQGKTVKCPVCKSKIDVIDRWDPAVQLSDTLTRYLTGLSPMVLLSFGVGGVLMSSALYGMQALETFAGPEAAIKYIFLEPETEGYLEIILGRLRKALPSLVPNDRAAAQDMLRRENISVSGGATVDWIHFFSLTLVAPALVLNRMPLGEAVMIPSSLMYAMFLSDHKTDALVWPPSGQKALLAFPVIRAFYFHVHRAISRTLDQRLAVATAGSVTGQGEPAGQALARREDPPAPGHEDEDEDENIIDINFDLNLGGAGDDAAAERVAPANQPQDNNAAPARPNRGVGGLGAVLNYLAGALMWPTVSYGAGSLLRLALPAAWVNKPSSGPVTGILQESAAKAVCTERIRGQENGEQERHWLDDEDLERYWAVFDVIGTYECGLLVAALLLSSLVRLHCYSARTYGKCGPQHEH